MRDDASDIVFICLEPIGPCDCRIGRCFSSLSVRENPDTGRITSYLALTRFGKAFWCDKLQDGELYWALNTFC